MHMIEKRPLSDTALSVTITIDALIIRSIPAELGGSVFIARGSLVN